LLDNNNIFLQTEGFPSQTAENNGLRAAYKVYIKEAVISERGEEMNNDSKYLVALILIAIGLVLLLNNLGVTDINLWLYWPVLLILWGLKSLFRGSRHLAALALSLLVVVFGLVLLTNNLKLTTVNIGRIFEIFLPLVVIIIGLSLLGSRKSKTFSLAFMGGVERGKNETWKLESGTYFAFMGGIELDLRQAEIPAGNTFLDLTAIMGGIDVIVPPDLKVVADGMAVLGGVGFFGKESGGILGSVRYEQGMDLDTVKTLIIQARAIMGGIELKY
jgi:predicted membrane protein